MKCPFCAEEIQEGAKKCKHCGSSFTKTCSKCGGEMQYDAIKCKHCGAEMMSTGEASQRKLVAILLCFFLGGLGIHKFYIGDTGMGILYIVLCLTSILIIPGIVLFVLVLIDFIKYLMMTDAEFGEYVQEIKRKKEAAN